jgi:hypothetical protein
MIASSFFALQRHADASGVSGTGRVAEGFLRENGECVLVWLTETPTISFKPSFEAALQVHEHKGSTAFVSEPSEGRTFYLDRTVDKTGISGTGRVAQGLQFSNGFCLLQWLVEPRSEDWHFSIESIQKIHGHDGTTTLVFAGGSHE